MANKKLNLRPLSDRVVIEPHKKADKTNLGIFLPDMSKEKLQRGTVLAAGPGRVDHDGKRIEMEVKTSDVVVYAGFTGIEVKFGDKKLLILKESDILAIIVN